MLSAPESKTVWFRAELNLAYWVSVDDVPFALKTSIL